MRKTISRRAAPAPTATHSRSIVTSHARKLEAMHELAYELGFFCAPATTFMVDLASKIAVHLKNRSGKVVYQSAAFSMENFPLELARQAFAMASVSPSTSPATTTWTVATQAQVQLVFGSIFEDHHAFCAGASKAIQTKSQPVIRLLATILKGAEISHVQLARGVQRLYINFQYALSDETGELHLPKDNNRIEIAFSEADLHEIRAQVATDAALLGMMGLPLSAKWWRQVGNEEEAQMAEALVQNLSTQPPVVKGKRRQAKDRYNVETVLKVNSTGNWALVQWEGYHPSWEAWRIHGEEGTPLETWEPKSFVQRTAAWRAWRS